MKFILFNGAPDSGKDTIADLMGAEIRRKPRDVHFYLPHHHYLPIRTAMATPVKITVAKRLGFSRPEFLEPFKDVQADPDFPTYRQNLIVFSEGEKKQYGSDVWVNGFCKEVRDLHMLYPDHPKLYILSDVGFNEEVSGIVDAFGKHAVCIVKVTRRGADYKNKNDSRYDVEVPEGVASIELGNNGTLREAVSGVLIAVDRWLTDTLKHNPEHSKLPPKAEGEKNAK